MNKSITRLFVLVLSVILIFTGTFVSVVNAISNEQNNTIDSNAVTEYIIVEMENEYSFPEQDYDANYFDSELVSAVEPVTTWQKDSLTDRDKYNLVLKLYLTEQGKNNIDFLIEKLSKRHDIKTAEYDYICNNAAADIENVSDWIPYENYILVEMENDYSFPEKDYDADYFDSELVSAAEPITTWQKNSLTDRDKYNLVLKLYLTEKGKENIDYAIEKLSAREDIRIAERDYMCKNVSAAISP